MQTGKRPTYTLISDAPETLQSVAEQFERDGYASRHPWYEHDWDVIWSYFDPYGGERPLGPATLRAGQLINRYPQSSFCDKLRLVQLPFDFIPLAFDLPQQLDDFAESYREHPEKLWVRKNRSHRGVRLTSPHEIDLFLQRSSVPIFVQEFIAPTHLICRRKWDVGVYVLLTSLEPLRLYVYDDIVLHFCPKDFPDELDPADVGSYVVADDYTTPWALEGFEPYRAGQRFAVDMLQSWFAQHEPKFDWERDFRGQCHGAVYDIVSAHVAEMLEQCREYPAGQQQFFELYRCDFAFDANLDVHLMEVNMSPNLSALANPPLNDLFTRLVRDVFGLVGISGGPEFLRRKRQDPAFAAASELASCGSWTALTAAPERNARRETVGDRSRVRRNPAIVNNQNRRVSTATNGVRAAGLPFTFSLHGAAAQIEVSSSQELDALYGRLPPGTEADPDARPDVVYRISAEHQLVRDGELRLRARSTDEALDALISDLHFQLACHARTALFVHAGVVALNGSAIIFPGRSHSGKSTLVAALVEAGATYFSDEYAVLDESGRVHPYLKPISLRDADGVGWPCSVASLGGHSGSGPVPVGLVVHTRYEPTSTWTPRSLSAAQALLAMVENTVRAREKPELMLRVLGAVAETTTAIASERGETGEVIRDLFRRHTSLSAAQIV